MNVSIETDIARFRAAAARLAQRGVAQADRRLFARLIRRTERTIAQGEEMSDDKQKRHEAYRAILDKEGIDVLNRTASELRMLGLDLPQGARTVADSDLLRKDAVIVCPPIALGAAMMFPDNLICDCAWGCGRKIEHRPHYPQGVVYACCFCVAERAQQGEH